MSSEPFRLRKWNPHAATEVAGRLFTCGRPGRATYGREVLDIEPEVIEAWIHGLPHADELHIVSLLGSKPNRARTSEFVYYPFRSSLESNEKPDIESWLEQHSDRNFVVHEFPTVDTRRIPRDVLENAVNCIRRLVDSGKDVVVVDSGGVQRTSRVCKALGAHPN